MRKFVGLILLVTLFLSSIAIGFDPSAMNPQSQVHNVHIGPSTVGLNCDTCHGFPPNVIQVQNGSGPGHFIVCENCHAAPPDSMKPSMGNLIVIHLSRGLYCTNCHDTTKITPAHLSTKAENGTVQVIKCENCHANPQNSISHVNGGKYCLDCHGDKTAAYIAPTTTPLVIPVSPTPTVQAYSARKITVKLDTYRGFLPVTQTIKAGDEIIWENNDAETVTLVSSDGLFEAKLLSNGERASHIFVKPRTYVFYLNEYKNLKGTVIVSGAESSGASQNQYQVQEWARNTVIVSGAESSGASPASTQVSATPVSTYAAPTEKVPGFELAAAMVAISALYMLNKRRS